jgi:hypothetical protein
MKATAAFAGHLAVPYIGENITFLPIIIKPGFFNMDWIGQSISQNPQLTEKIVETR